MAAVTVRGALSRLATVAADLLFPALCAGCGRIGWSFCPHCAQSVEPFPSSICARCGRAHRGAVPVCSLCVQEEPFPFAFVRVAALYKEPLRTAIHAFKYEARRDLAYPLSRYLIAGFQQPPWPRIAHSLDGCVPVPLHPGRQLERGYNQSALLAGHFSHTTGLPLHDTWLARSRETRSQAELPAAERRRNVAGAFTAGPQVAGRRLLLVDDVTTTGATFAACAHALRNAGAEAVYGFALAMPALAG